MQRPRAITAITVLHLAYAALLAALTAYCMVLARHAATISKPDAGGAASGLVIGAVCLGVFAVLYAISAAGLWRVRRWGWVLALAVNALVPFFVLLDIFVDRDRDPDNWVPLVMFGVPILLLLLPAVRRPFFRAATASAAISS